jgi:hypothetical protein
MSTTTTVSVASKKRNKTSGVLNFDKENIETINQGTAECLPSMPLNKQCGQVTSRKSLRLSERKIQGVIC